MGGLAKDFGQEKPVAKSSLSPFDHKHFARLADGLAVALAVSLPWSTSATAVIAGLWLLAFLPTLDLPSLRRVVSIPAGALPVLFVMLGALGTSWTDAPWADRLDGLGSFVKLLFIPLLMHQFGRSNVGRQVLIGFVSSCVVLLVVSWSFWAYGLPTKPHGVPVPPGIPVKDYVSQSGMFTI